MKQEREQKFLKLISNVENQYKSEKVREEQVQVQKNQEIVKIHIKQRTKKVVQLQMKQKKLIEAAMKDKFELKEQSGFQYNSEDANKQDKYRNTALFYAAYNLNEMFVDFMINTLNADPNIKCQNNETPVHAAFKKSDPNKFMQ